MVKVFANIKIDTLNLHVFYSVRFYISWILSAILMYGAFYFWHGIFLNDLNNISFPIFIFLGLAALVYLGISFVLFRIFESKYLTKQIYSPMLRGVASGVIVGFFLFALVTVLGISFTKNQYLTYILADCAWQMVEQVIGGIVIAFGKIIIYDHARELNGD